jgi:O-6-methylguanine DNA methyltransferase
MNGQQSGPQTVRDSRALVEDLRGLADVRAPATLLPQVLDELGLADRYLTLETPLGQVYVAYNPRGISAVQRAEGSEAFEAAFRAQFGRAVFAATEPPERLVRALERRLRENAGELRFDLRGLSEFERAVLLKALEIPRGEVRPYAWIAREIGRPRAVRAVGSALGHNPVPLLIPCHRVVRSDGHLGQYSLGGPQAKRAILQAEGLDPQALEALASSGVRYFGSDTTRIYCFPTCRHARRIGERHRVPFGSDAEAVAAGYRPCHVCRPAPDTAVSA